jgi:hypothetical protein
MNLTEVKSKAKEVGVSVSKMKKPELIRAIQLAEGNVDCFGKPEGACDQENCCFRSDCL